MSLDRVIGQEHAAAQVTAWLRASRMPHAILLCGPPGTGKRGFALELAKGMICAQRSGLACDHCVACHRAERLLHPDVHMLVPLAPRRGKKEEEAGPDEMRQAVLEYLAYQGEPWRSSANIARQALRLLQREMAYTPVEARSKVAVIYEAECMHPAGANSLLKVLEEPPSDAAFILVSATPDQVLPTIRSRCQRLTLRRLTLTGLRDHLTRTGVEPGRLELAARLGGGNLQRAARAAAGELDPVRERVEEFLRAAAVGDDDAYWALVDEVGARSERGQLEGFLEMCAEYLRDLFLAIHGRHDQGVLVDRQEVLQQLGSRLVPAQVQAAALEVDRAFDGLYRNANPQLVLADLWRVLRGPGQKAAAAAESVRW